MEASAKGDAAGQGPDVWRPIEEVSAGGDADGSGLTSLQPMLRRSQRYLETHGRRSAMIGLALTFVLLFVSQWASWADVSPDKDSRSSSVGVGISEGPTILVLTYYLMWMIVLALAGATVFAPRRARPALFGASMSAIVVQFIAIVPLLRHPKDLVGGDVVNLPQFGTATELVVTRQGGMFCAVAALLVLAATLVFAAGGDVWPSPTVDKDAEPGTLVGRPTPLADDDDDVIRAAVESASAAGRHSAAPARPAPPAAGLEVNALTVESVEALPDPTITLAEPVQDVDHTAYLRPLGNEQYRR